MATARSSRIGLLALVFFLAVTMTASARQPASGSQKTNVLRALDTPGVAPALPECTVVWTDDIRGAGQWAYAIVTRDTGPCSKEQAGGGAYLDYGHGEWHVVVEGDEISCHDGGSPKVPIEVQADLLGCPR
jgi:hypothetical protein